MFDRVEELLPLVSKPIQYVGGEVNAVSKDWDSVDVRFELDGKTFIAIDTPGVKREKTIADDLEFYGIHRAQRSIRRADVVLIFFDASEPISRVVENHPTLKILALSFLLLIGLSLMADGLDGLWNP